MSLGWFATVASTLPCLRVALLEPRHSFQHVLPLLPLANSFEV